MAPRRGVHRDFSASFSLLDPVGSRACRYYRGEFLLSLSSEFSPRPIFLAHEFAAPCLVGSWVHTVVSSLPEAISTYLCLRPWLPAPVVWLAIRENFADLARDGLLCFSPSFLSPPLGPCLFPASRSGICGRLSYRPFLPRPCRFSCLANFVC